MPPLTFAAAAALAAGGLGLARTGRRHQVEDVIVSAVLVASGVILTAGIAVGHAGPWTVLAGATVGAATALPLALPGWNPSRTAARHWRSWCTAGVVLGLLVAVALAVAPQLSPPSASVELTLVALAVIDTTAFTSVAWRLIRRYRLGRQQGPLLAAVGIGVTAAAILAAVLAPDAAAIGAVTGLALAALGVNASGTGDPEVAAHLAPLVTREPLLTVELQLTPVVQRYVAALERKDPLTRDHGLRVGELAMRVGAQAGLSPERLQALGLAALLHDVGKLFTPDSILLSSTTLTPAELDAVREHPAWGAELMASSPMLAPAADLVRWHHERVDGTGYPDGLRGSQIPLEAAIISVCDAWDAMTFSLRYRSAMSPERARWVLLGGSGSQWSPRAVELLLEELAAHGPVDHSVYDAIPHPTDGEDVDDDAIPDEAKRQLT